jgi:hypothetical protein
MKKNYGLKTLLMSGMMLFFMHPVFADNYFVVQKEQLTPQRIKQDHPMTVDGLPDHVLKLALNAYHAAVARHEVHNQSMLTIVDFNKPSYKKRLWVIDLHNKHVIMSMHVAQGTHSGKIYATRFSNVSGTHESSLGVFTTVGDEYYGTYGKALRLKGLEPGINNNAYYRGIVLHSETEVSPQFIKAMGYAGHTWGCFAVNPAHIQRLIHLLQGGSVLFAYASSEKTDPLVDHPMSSHARALYGDITTTNANPVVRFFEAF